jgi:GTPase SAR1 family protein
VYQQIKNQNANIDAMDKHLYGLSAEERIARIGEMARETALAIGVDPALIDESLSCARRQIEAAKEPFRLGVIGEFRVGKSTLINALLGQEVAFADIVEATASECRFRHGALTSATFIYADREPEEFGVEEANRILSDRREDARWLGSLDHVEYSVDADCLRSFDLWDAPGIGGSEGNERLANRFIERLGGALWVMDANLIGKASIAGPLNQLKDSGKPVICILNRIDEYSGDPTEIIHFVERSYPGVFSAIVPISAYTAFLDKISGRTSPDIDDLWSIVLSVMGGDEAQGGDTRLQSTIGIAGKKVGSAVVALKRELQDRIGLVEHMRYNLRAAGAKLFLALPHVLADETEKAFTALEIDLWKQVDDAKGGRKDVPIPVDMVIAFLKDERRLSTLTETVTGATMQRLKHMWSSLTDDAFCLSLAAVSLPSNALSTFSVARAAGADTQLSKQAIEEGVYVGGVSAVIAGTLAAASTLVTWPVILAAIPIGALAAWREQKKANAPTIDFSEEVSKLLAAMKQQFVVTLGKQIRGAIESAIEVEIDRSLEKRTIDTTGAQDVQVARELESRLVLMADALNVPSHHVTRSEWSGAEVLALLENPGSRLDLYLPDISFSLSALLISLPPETEIRVLVAATRNELAGLPDEVDRAFGGWAGKKRVRSITNATGDALVGLPTMIIVSEEALVTDESLRGLSNQGMRFEPYAQGRVAAQRLFASLWEGRGRGGESLEVAPVL